MKINTILFDLDGTLIDTNDLIMDSFKHVFHKFKIEDVSLDLLKSFVGPPLHQSFSHFTKDEKRINEMIDCYRKFNIPNHDKYVKAYAQVYETLCILERLGYNLAIVTSKHSHVAEMGIKLANIKRFFKVFIYGDDCLNHKPHPEGIIKALSKFDNVTSALMVGDAPSDILAGKNANILTMGVSWSINYEKLIQTKPDFMINQFDEIIELIK